MLSNCLTCKFFSKPIHTGDLACAIDPRYVKLWNHLKTLPQSEVETLPIDLCSQFEPLPPYNPSLPCIRRSLDGRWNFLESIRSAWQGSIYCYDSLSQLLQTEQVAIADCFSDETGEFFTVFQKRSSSRSSQRVTQSTQQVSGNRQQAIEAFELIDMIEVNSSHITDIGYHDPLQILFVRFDTTGLYAYFNVPDNVWFDFRSAPSKGRFRNQEIEGHYSYVPL